VRRSRLFSSALSVVCLAAILGFAPAAAQAAGPRLDLKILVVTDRQPAAEAILAQLAAEGVPHTTIDLTSAGRPVIDAAYLADTVNGAPRGKFQAVVLPNENPFTDPAELAALHAYEKQFGVRQLDAYTWANPAVGLNYPHYSGELDGTAATATSGAVAGPMRYLRGPVAFEDNAADVSESYGFLAEPLPDDTAAGTSFEPYLTASAPGGTGSGVLAGVYTRDGRSELVMTFSYNRYQRQFRLLAHGIITWLTRGIHLGYYRNYFAVHVDDVFLPDSRWSVEHNCTPGEDCLTTPGQPPVTTPEIRMTPDDVTHTVNWQRQAGFTLDMLYNGGGSDQAVAATGSDPLTTAFLANKAEFRWANHTYEHPFMGCIQDYTVSPWRCATDPVTGAVKYMTRAAIVYQINQNKAWARNRGIPIQAGELVTGEHSGMRILPQQPADNPNLAPAFTQTGVLWAGSDNSRDPVQRRIGSALTVPRHPMNVFFNVATVEEEVDEYNWIYTSRANGGSGICEDNPAITTCIAPLDLATGYSERIVPQETRIALSHVLANDPRPHYVHQSNLTEGRILYPVLDAVLAEYRATFAANTPIVNQRMSAIGTQLQREGAWRAALNAGQVSGYVQDGKVVILAPSGTDVPITVPEGTRRGGLTTGPLFGQRYAGERSAYDRPVFGAITLLLPAGA
jgi:hypothetical protein